MKLPKKQRITAIIAVSVCFAGAMVAGGCSKTTEDPKIDPAKAPAGAVPHAVENQSGPEFRHKAK